MIKPGKLRIERSAQARRLRLGVDIGGTFTDLVIMDEETGAITIEKVPSTPSDPSMSFHAIMLQGLAAAGADAGDVGYLVHGTTVATNMHHRGKDGRMRLAHHGRLPRHPRDRARSSRSRSTSFSRSRGPWCPATAPGSPANGWIRRGASSRA